MMKIFFLHKQHFTAKHLLDMWKEGVVARDTVYKKKFFASHRIWLFISSSSSYFFRIVGKKNFVCTLHIEQRPCAGSVRRHKKNSRGELQANCPATVELAESVSKLTFLRVMQIGINRFCMQKQFLNKSRTKHMPVLCFFPPLIC